ncbi:unnamed protein product [Gadus morhua 'NCC']
MRRVPKKVNRLLGRDFFPILFEEQVSSATLAPGVFRDQSWGVCGGTEPSALNGRRRISVSTHSSPPSHLHLYPREPPQPGPPSLARA